MSTPGSQRIEFSSPDFSFAHQTSQTFPIGTDTAVIAQAQIEQLRQTEAFLADIESSLHALSKTRRLSEGEEAGRRQARAWRQQAATERAEIEYREQLIACDRPSQHIANAIRWNAICTDPDWCEVGGTPVAFDSVAVIEIPVLASPNVKAQDVPVYRVDDMHFGVQAVAGRSLGSGSAAGSGFVKVLTGARSVYVNNKPVARNASAALINCGPDGLGGVRGALLTEEKPPSPPPAPAQPNEQAPPGQRTSPRLEELKRAEAALQERLVNVDGVDDYIRFDDLYRMMDSGIQGTEGTWTDYLAQATRGVLKAGVAVGEGAVGLGKLAVSASQRQTPTGMMLTTVQAQIAAENIRLGNTTLGTASSAAGDIALAIVVPPEAQTAWKRGDYVEAGTNTGINIATLGGFGNWLRKLTGSGKAADDVVTAGGAGRRADGTAEPEAPTPQTEGPGVHVSPTKPPPDGWATYKTHGIYDDPMASPEGRRLVEEYREQGFSDKHARDKARELLQSGSNLPQAKSVAVGDRFYKLVPEGGSVGPSSAYWATRSEIDALRGLSRDQIASRLGLPLQSQQAPRFDILEIRAQRPTTVFVSRIAPTTQNGWHQTGGGIQSLVIDRSHFSAPVPTGGRLP